MTFDMLQDKLKNNPDLVKHIESNAEAGNVNAQRIIQMHGMVRSCPGDPGARAFCVGAYQDWVKEKAESPGKDNILQRSSARPDPEVCLYEDEDLMPCCDPATTVLGCKDCPAPEQQ